MWNLRYAVFFVLIAHTAQAKFEQIADAAGFRYDSSHDIYKTKIDALQRVFGYHQIFDFFAPWGAMVFDAEPIVFDYDDKTYMIEIWKGQYFVATGVELGIYEWNGYIWEAVKNEDMLFMRYTVKNDEENIFTLEGVHWWLAGFKPGVFAELDNLVLEDVYIEFKTSLMRDAFYQSLKNLGYEDVADKIDAPSGQNNITFTVTAPKSRQPQPPLTKKYYQFQNRIAVKMFNFKKKKIEGLDNSPETIDKMIGIK